MSRRSAEVAAISTSRSRPIVPSPMASCEPAPSLTRKGISRSSGVMREVASRSSALTCTTTSGTQNHVRNPCTATTARLRATGARNAVRIAIPVSSDAARMKNAASAAARAAYQRTGRGSVSSVCRDGSTSRGMRRHAVRATQRAADCRAGRPSWRAPRHAPRSRRPRRCGDVGCRRCRRARVDEVMPPGQRRPDVPEVAMPASRTVTKRPSHNATPSRRRRARRPGCARRRRG